MSPPVWCASCHALARPAAVSATNVAAVATIHRRSMCDNKYAGRPNAAKCRRGRAAKPQSRHERDEKQGEKEARRREGAAISEDFPKKRFWAPFRLLPSSPPFLFSLGGFAAWRLSSPPRGGLEPVLEEGRDYVVDGSAGDLEG